MTHIALLLVVFSAVVHAGWNLLSKSLHPSSSFFLLTSLVGAALLSPVLWLPGFHPERVPAGVWLLLGATGFCMAVYYAALAGAYRSGHLSVAYPVARSFPVIVVVVAALLLGRGEQITRQCVLGILLVVAGGFLVPMRSFADFRIANYLNPTCLFALLAAFGTAGYTIIDDEALRQLRNARPDLGPARATLLYASLETGIAAAWQAVFVALQPAGRAELRQDLKINKRNAVIAGAAIWLAYGLILVALAFARNVSYVAAFRQLSIPLGTAFGIGALKEPFYGPKLAGVGAMFLGLLLVAGG